ARIAATVGPWTDATGDAVVSYRQSGQAAGIRVPRTVQPIQSGGAGTTDQLFARSGVRRRRDDLREGVTRNRPDGGAVGARTYQLALARGSRSGPQHHPPRSGIRRDRVARREGAHSRRYGDGKLRTADP